MVFNQGSTESLAGAHGTHTFHKTPVENHLITRKIVEATTQHVTALWSMMCMTELPNVKLQAYNIAINCENWQQ